MLINPDEEPEATEERGRTGLERRGRVTGGVRGEKKRSVCEVKACKEEQEKKKKRKEGLD